MNIALSFECIPAVSAIYYGLLQSGYAFYAPEKDQQTIQSIENFRNFSDACNVSFWAGTHQTSCEVYPYWPRAALLESATFCLDRNQKTFEDWDIFRQEVMSAENLSEDERNEDFWTWIGRFPEALSGVLSSADFRYYLKWEQEWLSAQASFSETEIHLLRETLNRCAHAYHSPIRQVSILLSPIKCAYSADYHLKNGHLYFSSGRFSPSSVLHEFLHPIVHPCIDHFRDEISDHSVPYPGIDESYYRSGKANAFEEYCVRRLEQAVTRNETPDIYPLLSSISAEFL